MAKWDAGQIHHTLGRVRWPPNCSFLLTRHKTSVLAFSICIWKQANDDALIWSILIRIYILPRKKKIIFVFFEYLPKVFSIHCKELQLATLEERRLDAITKLFSKYKITVIDPIIYYPHRDHLITHWDKVKNMNHQNVKQRDTKTVQSHGAYSTSSDFFFTSDFKRF